MTSPSLYDLAYECHDLVQEYWPDCRCTIHEMVGIWNPEADDDDPDKWLDGVTVRVWKSLPGHPDRMVLECGPAAYRADVVDCLRRALDVGQEEEDDGYEPEISGNVLARLQELLFHPLTPTADRRLVMLELLPNLTRARAAALTEILVERTAPGGQPGRGWVPGKVELNLAPHPFSSMPSH